MEFEYDFEEVCLVERKYRRLIRKFVREFNIVNADVLNISGIDIIKEPVYLIKNEKENSYTFKINVTGTGIYMDFFSFKTERGYPLEKIVKIKKDFTLFFINGEKGKFFALFKDIKFDKCCSDMKAIYVDSQI